MAEAGPLPTMGLMQQWPLNVSRILDYAARWHPEQEIVTRNVEGGTTISTYADMLHRVKLLTLGLHSLGVRQGTYAATLAWNTARHMEVWYALMGGCGAICHTLNPRLSDADLVYIINDAGDQYLLADANFAPILSRVLPQCPCVKQVVFLTDRLHMPTGCPLKSVDVLCYEELLAAQLPHLSRFQWTEVPETAACGMCYTSGTTGKPKGVLYSHRSNFLHAMLMLQADCVPLSSSSSVLAIVPMFHANSWGLVFAGPMVGAKMVLPGPFLDGDSVYDIIETHRVTVTAAVPTVILQLLMHVEKHSLKFSTFSMCCLGGAAPPLSMIQALERKHNVTVRHIWGMTELSPLGTQAAVKAAQARRASPDEVLVIKSKQGRPHILCDLRIVDDEGKVQPHDGKAVGHLEVKGDATVQRYFKATQDATNPGNWFPTGDVACIDKWGNLQITDRSKDVIKSGGEWISSIEVENIVMGHEDVAEAAVVGIPDDKWGERPLLVVVLRPHVESSAHAQVKAKLLEYLDGRIARYAMPDDVVFVDEIPHTSVGKVSKLQLRHLFSDPKARAATRSRL